MTPRLRALSVVALLVLVAWVSVGVDASIRRARRGSRVRASAVVALVGVPDLVLSSNARWLRHPSSVEPWAAVSDAPASLDVEPAGGLLLPDPRVLGAGIEDVRRIP